VALKGNYAYSSLISLTEQKQQPFCGQPALAGTPGQFVEAKIYCPHVLADGS